MHQALKAISLSWANALLLLFSLETKQLTGFRTPNQECGMLPPRESPKVTTPKFIAHNVAVFNPSGRLRGFQGEEDQVLTSQRASDSFRTLIEDTLMAAAVLSSKRPSYGVMILKSR